MDKSVYEVLEQYENLNEVQAIAIGGSSAAKTNDSTSDIDIYVFVKSDISLEKREQIARKYSTKYEVGGEYFGSGDEYFVAELGITFDIMYWNVNWFNSIVENVWEKNYPSNGYTTCFLYTLSNFEILVDKIGWLTNLKQKINQPYPKNLKKNIIERNLNLMKDKPFASYYEQIEKALNRGDIVSVNHRISAFLASYFDIIFAINELLHPGEKRLIKYSLDNCELLPDNFEENIQQLLKQPDLTKLDKILENLRAIL